MNIQEFKDNGGCNGCYFYGVVDVDGRKECKFHWCGDFVHIKKNIQTGNGEIG